VGELDCDLLFPGKFLVNHHDEYLLQAGLGGCLDAVIAGEHEEGPVGLPVAQRHGG